MKIGHRYFFLWNLLSIDPISKGIFGSLGGHIHLWPLRRSHIDLHILWWVISFGPDVRNFHRQALSWERKRGV